MRLVVRLRREIFPHLMANIREVLESGIQEVQHENGERRLTEGLSSARFTTCDSGGSNEKIAAVSCSR